MILDKLQYIKKIVVKKSTNVMHIDISYIQAYVPKSAYYHDKMMIFSNENQMSEKNQNASDSKLLYP